MSPFISVRLLQTQSDERLLAAAREGHERAFEALVQRYRRPLLRYCRRLLLPDERAEDALQQALLQAWLALQRGADVRDPKAWLYRVVHNTAIDALRTSGYDHEQLSDSLRGASAPESDLERRTAVRQALAGLAALPELQREALMRTAVEGQSHGQVAAALGLSDGAVRGLVYRARATLRAAVTAVTPMPLFAWAASAGHRGAPLAQRLGGMGGGGGVAGAAGATGGLVKGGAALLTAGALVVGAVTVQHRSSNPHSPHRAGSTETAGASLALGGIHEAERREPAAPGGGHDRAAIAAPTPAAASRAGATPEAGGHVIVPSEAPPGRHAAGGPGEGQAGREAAATAEAHVAEGLTGTAGSAGGEAGAGNGAGTSPPANGTSGGGGGVGTPGGPMGSDDRSEDGTQSAPSGGSDGSRGDGAPPPSGSGSTGATGSTGSAAPESDR